MLLQIISAESLIEDLLEPVEIVEAEEIVTANCNIHQHENLVVSPKVKFHTADTAVVTVSPAKGIRDRKFSIALIEKAFKFKKALSLPRFGSRSKQK